MRRFLNGLGLATLLASASASAQVMVGAYVPGDGFNRSEIVSYNEAMPKSLAFVNIFSSFSHDWDHLYWQSSNIVSEGAMPLISWMPVDLNRPNENILSEIALGLHDEYLDKWGEKLVAWVAQYPVEQQPKILLRFGHEFNGNWYAYGNSPFFFQSAWQYIHDRFESAGVNQYVEWVWSANNVNVDDYDDITLYYPGSEYVDWTSIDGYNFGSNYSWTDWESFSSLYSDIYLTLVDNYPEKPVLIAEVGSAEQADLPDPSWGQFGDNSDAYQSKDTWISTFLTELEANFPAVRAIAWFNTNKELDWSLTDSSNTGITSWINGVQSDYYISDFLSASSVDPVENSELAALEAQLVWAQENYTVAKNNFDTSELRVTQIEGDIQREVEISQSLLDQKGVALSQLKVTRGKYLTARADYLESHSAFIGFRQSFLTKRSQVVESRELYFEKNGAYRDARTKWQNARLVSNEARQRHTSERNAFLAALETMQHTREKYLDAKQAEDADIESMKEEFDTALAAYREARDIYIPQRSIFLERMQFFWVARDLYTDSVEKRREALNLYRQEVAENKSARHNFASSTQQRKVKLDHLRYVLGLHQERNVIFREIDKEYQENVASLNRLNQELSDARALHQSYSAALMDAYSNVASVEQQHSLYTENSGGLMLSDASNSKKEENVSKDKGSDEAGSNGQILAAHNSKKLTKTVNIDKADQKALAQSRRPDPIDPGKLNERKEKYKNMSVKEREALSQQKLSVLWY